MLFGLLTARGKIIVNPWRSSMTPVTEEVLLIRINPVQFNSLFGLK